MSCITDHSGRVSPVFSSTLFTVIVDASLTDGRAMCVFYLNNQNSSHHTHIGRNTSSRLRSMHQLLMICEEFD